MNKITAILIAGFLVAFAAGGSIGMLAGPEPPEPPRQEPGPPPLRELDLTPEQQEQMRRIWSQVGPGPREAGRDRGRELWQKRQEAMDAFLAELTDEQRRRYDQINEEFRQGMEERMRERQGAIEEAVRRTREVLTPEQIKIYERMRQHGRRGRYEPGPPSAGPHHPGRPGGPGRRRGGPKSFDGREGRGGPFRMPFDPSRRGDPRRQHDRRPPRQTQPTTRPWT